MELDCIGVSFQMIDEFVHVFVGDSHFGLPHFIGLKRIKRIRNWNPNRKDAWEYYTTGRGEVGEAA